MMDGDCPGAVAGSQLAARLQPCALVPHGHGRAGHDPPFRSPKVRTCVSSVQSISPGTKRATSERFGWTTSRRTSRSQAPSSSTIPELIRATLSDAQSGVASGQLFYRAEGEGIWQPLETVLAGGELRARVDSTSVPAGIYEFRAVVTDNAGNQAETTQREDGREMALPFPLKSGVDLSAALEPGGAKRTTIPYGRRSRVAGVLREASGDPIAGQEIVIEEYFGDGALIRERITRVQTDGRGRWTSKLPAGPSRRVTATYAGTQRYLSEATLGGRLAVRTKASLRTSKARVPEGGKVMFRGKLGRLGARIPARGKPPGAAGQAGSPHLPDRRRGIPLEAERQLQGSVPLRPLLPVRRALQVPRQGRPRGGLAVQGAGPIARANGHRPRPLTYDPPMRIRDRLTYANVVSTLALVLVIGGGGAYAAGFIDSGDIVNNSIESRDLENRDAVRLGTSARTDSQAGRSRRRRSTPPSSLRWRGGRQWM